MEPLAVRIRSSAEWLGNSMNGRARLGNDHALTDGNVVGPAIAAEDMFKYSCLNPGTGATIRSLSNLAPRTLALMRGPSFTGDGVGALRNLADDYDRRVSSQVSEVLRSVLA